MAVDEPSLLAAITLASNNLIRLSVGASPAAGPAKAGNVPNGHCVCWPKGVSNAIPIRQSRAIAAVMNPFGTTDGFEESLLVDPAALFTETCVSSTSPPRLTFNPS